MTSLLIILIGTITVFPHETVQINCFMCDNDADKDGCDETNLKADVTCAGETCSVTSYVRLTATGC